MWSKENTRYWRVMKERVTCCNDVSVMCDVDGFLDNNGALGCSAMTHIRIWICWQYESVGLTHFWFSNWIFLAPRKEMEKNVRLIPEDFISISCWRRCIYLAAIQPYPFPNILSWSRSSHSPTSQAASVLASGSLKCICLIVMRQWCIELTRHRATGLFTAVTILIEKIP